MTRLYAAQVQLGYAGEEIYVGRHNKYYYEKIIKYRHTGAKKLAVVAARLLEYAAKRGGITGFTETGIAENAYGKPYLTDFPAFHFNLSHSGAWVVCAVSSCPAGVDVQEVCAKTDLDIAERFFCASEAAAMRRLAIDEQRSRFFDYWALKESYIKAEGKGLSIPLDSFCFELRGKSIEFTGEKSRDWKFKLYDFAEQYKLAICIDRQREFPVVEDVTAALERESNERA